MEYKQLGSSGLKVSKIILGAMSIGSPSWQPWVQDEENSLEILEHAYNVGINTWDTADIYSHGESERIIGKALKKYKIPRENVVLLTKAFFGVSHDGTQIPLPQCSDNDGNMVNRVGLSRKKILAAVDSSVERLGTYIDVFQIHRLDRSTPKEEIMRALNDVVESGKVRYIGASSMAAWEFQQLQNIAEKHGWHKFISMQNLVHLLYREEEREMIPYCTATGVGLIPWSPLARGTIARPCKSQTTRRGETDEYGLPEGPNEEADKTIVSRVEELAKKKEVPMSAVGTAWVLQKGACPIVGLSTRERIDQSLLALSTRLSEDEIKYLEEPYLPRAVTGY